MKNSVDVYIEFSFKGESYALTSTVDLDLLLARQDSLSFLYTHLANEHSIDTYSYLFEVMQDANIEFRNVQGVATEFMADGTFNFAELKSHWENSHTPALLQPIALQEMGISDLNQHPSLKNALIKAYYLGKESNRN